MSTQTTIQIRIDSKIKREAKRTLEEIGLDLSSGLKLFLHNIAITQSVPLDLRTANGFTIRQEQEMLREAKDALEKGRRYVGVRKMHEEVLSSED
ncbi:MAG: type II toxin-antitoxin system RelB/DinJ family antitoxin [Candidatus Vogelbacteria bacterium]|nr:type II toxin-antitoxin system RelB/DinJ family antitoxin [Candidatus Vogelbacteria bacterium]